jgi:hypothetical protein
MVERSCAPCLPSCFLRDLVGADVSRLYFFPNRAGERAGCNLPNRPVAQVIRRWNPARQQRIVCHRVQPRHALHAPIHNLTTASPKAPGHPLLSGAAGHRQELLRRAEIRAIRTCLRALHIVKQAFCMLSGTIVGQRAGAAASSVGAPYTFEVPGAAGKMAINFFGTATGT